jgi:hypothetical protein
LDVSEELKERLLEADIGNNSRHRIIRSRHSTAEAKKQHEAMGFHSGWASCADQLEEIARTF